jgi:hypothetical protein
MQTMTPLQSRIIDLVVAGLPLADAEHQAYREAMED